MQCVYYLQIYLTYFVNSTKEDILTLVFINSNLFNNYIVYIVGEMDQK